MDGEKSDSIPPDGKVTLSIFGFPVANASGSSVSGVVSLHEIRRFWKTGGLCAMQTIKRAAQHNSRPLCRSIYLS
jgi:hypothetical protein